MKAVDEHRFHSPFLYTFFEEVIQDDRCFYPFEKLEKLREGWLREEKLIKLNGYGAGFSGKVSEESKSLAVHRIAKKSLNPPRFSRMLFKALLHGKGTRVLELGGSLGLNAMYLASVGKGVNCYSLEGEPELIQWAREEERKLEENQVHWVEGDIYKTLDDTLSKEKEWDLVFLDANHTKEATLDFSEKIIPRLNPRYSLLILDDVYWSKSMNAAFQELKKHPELRISLDFYKCAYLFFGKDLPKKEFSFWIPPWTWHRPLPFLKG